MKAIIKRRKDTNIEKNQVNMKRSRIKRNQSERIRKEAEKE